VSLLVSISTVLIIFSLLQVTTPYSRRPTYGLTQDFYYIGNQRWEQKRLGRNDLYLFESSLSLLLSA
jgi:hypothetical protein